MKRALGIVMGLLVLAASAQGATVAWSSVNISAESDVSTQGTLLEALNFGNSASAATVNGVAFAAANFAGPFTYLNAGDTLAGGVNHADFYQGAVTAYNAMLDYIRWESGSDTNPDTYTLSNLTPGHAYRIQFFFADARDVNAQTRQHVMDTGETNEHTTPQSGLTGFAITGEFTADAATQAFTVQALFQSNPHKVHMGAYQLRELNLGGPPVVYELNPEDNETGVGTYTDLVVTFDRFVLKGTGDIEIRRTSDDSLVETIDVTSGLVTIAGNAATIDPAADLPESTECYVRIDAGAFTAAVDPFDPFAGILDTTTWSFTTAAASTECDMLTLSWDGFDGVFSDQNVTLSVPYGTAVTALDPTFTISLGAEAAPPSETARNFTTPQTYRITAQDGTTFKDYTVTAVVRPPVALVYESFNYAAGGGAGGGGLNGHVAESGLGAWVSSGYNNGGGDALIQSPGLTYTDGNGNVLLVGGNRVSADIGAQFSATIDVTGWSDTNKDGGKLNKKGASIWWSTIIVFDRSDGKEFGTYALKDSGGSGYLGLRQERGGNWFLKGCNKDGVVATGAATYTLTDDVPVFMIGHLTTDASGNTTLDVWMNPLLTSAGDLGAADMTVTIAANGDDSATQFDTLAWFDENWGFNEFDEIRMDESFEPVVGKEAVVSSECDMLKLNWGAYKGTIVGTNVSLTVPLGTDVRSLDPTYTVSPFATGSPVSGTARDFTTPQTYTITAQDGTTTKDYMVTVVQVPMALVYESFNYAAGDGVLHGKTADAGLGAWVLNPTASGSVLSPGMTYTDGSTTLFTMGNRFETRSGYADVGYAPIDVSLWSAGNKDGGKLNRKGAEIWFSALMKTVNIVHNHFHLYFADAQPGWNAGPGYFAVGRADVLNATWEIRGDNDDGDSDQVDTSTVSATVETFILGRLTTDGTSGDTTMDVWFNPLLDTAPEGPGTGDLSITVPANDDGSVPQIDRIGYLHQKWESPNLLDEIRMDESFELVIGRAAVVRNQGMLLIVK